MKFYDLLCAKTVVQRAEFLSIQIIRDALAGDVDRPTYLAFLGEAFHHVKHTCPLLSLAASRCDGSGDAAYKTALKAYIDDEQGHDAWILEDIEALGGDRGRIAAGMARLPCQLMVAYAYYAINQISPYSLLGMIHVLEGMSVALAEQAATAIRRRLSPSTVSGFRYLTSHGQLDQNHVAFFETTVNGIEDPFAQTVIVDAARVFYRLYGDVFRGLRAGERT